jgi:D-3-phosphoglycerate dehydrogenase
MPHVLVAGKIHDDGLALLRAAPGFTLDVVNDGSDYSYRPFIPHAEAVLIRTQRMPAPVIEAAERLRIVSRHGVGYDSVDVAALSERRIPLAIVGDVNSVTVAEHTMMLILAVAKRAPLYDRSTRSGDWSVGSSFSAVELHGRKLLVVGFGRIGRRVAVLGLAFGMRVTGYDPFVDGTVMAAAGVAPAHDLAEALAAADVVSLHVPMSGSSPLIGASELALMKPSSFIINTARGGLIDEAALAVALAENRLAGAGLDVFRTEPIPEGNPLMDSDRVVLSPHSASLTAECAARMSVAAARNILDFFAGSLDRRLVVNPSVLGQ